jgi:hypothetical protein
VKPTQDVDLRHIVPALSDTGCDTSQCKLRRSQPEENDFNAIAGLFPAFDAAQVRQSAQCALEGEIQPCLCESIQFGEKQATSSQCSQFGTQRGVFDFCIFSALNPCSNQLEI